MAKNINGINFTDLSRIGKGSSFNNVINGDITSESDLQDYIEAGEEYRNIQSVLIDWNGAQLSYLPAQGTQIVNTTGDFLSIFLNELKNVG